MPEMFNETDLDQQRLLKRAFDPDQRLNPGKVFPLLCRCADHGAVRVLAARRRAACTAAWDGDRFDLQGGDQSRRRRRRPGGGQRPPETRYPQRRRQGRRRRADPGRPSPWTSPPCSASWTMTRPSFCSAVRPATPLARVLALIAERGQMLAFGPSTMARSSANLRAPRPSATSSRSPARSGCLAAGRDHLLGFRAVSGRGEVLIGGSRVVKNVTGYDLPKLVAGSWGRLVAVTEMHLKVVPHGPERVTMAVHGLDAGGLRPDGPPWDPRPTSPPRRTCRTAAA